MFKRCEIVSDGMESLFSLPFLTLSISLLPLVFVLRLSVLLYRRFESARGAVEECGGEGSFLTVIRGPDDEP